MPDRAPDHAVPGHGVPDRAVPDQAVPDQAVPDQAVPDQAVPDQAAPDHAHPAPPRRGRLRVYLGAAPGVGKTYAMLAEGHRRAERGTDVVVAVVETHGRAQTAALLDGLEIVPRRTLDHRGTTFTEMDLDAVLARRPAMALVDELAHTNVPGSAHDKRWQDVDELLAAGIDVVTTVNVQHLESLNDVVEMITGVRQQETLPDEVVRRADQIELVDMSPEALRRRLAHGNVYQADKVDAALTNYFRVGNLTALRELALLWTADRVDAALEAYRREHAIAKTWPARERIVVAVTGGPETETLVRRGARRAAQPAGAELHVLHVLRGDGLAGPRPDDLVDHRAFAQSLGATWHTVVSDDVAAAVLDFARGINASHVLLGASRRSRWRAALSAGIATRVIAGSGEIDVLIVTHESAARGRHAPPPRSGTLSTRRRVAAWVTSVVGPALLSVMLLWVPGLDSLPTVLMLFLTVTVAVALLGGLRPALVAAVAGGLLSNWWFTPPTRTLTITEPQNTLAIAVLIAVAVAVSAVVDLAARRTVEAGRARGEADTLTLLARSVLQGDEAIPAILDQLCETFTLDGAALLVRGESGDQPAAWTVAGQAGSATPSAPDGIRVAVAEDTELVLDRDRPLSTDDLRMITVVAQYLGAALERDRLRREARASRVERERTTTRTALLAAVSHDLRTPLAGIKAGVTALRSGVTIAPADRRELLAGVDHQADRLQLLIDNLLDMSRLDTGVVAARREPVALDEIVPRVVDSMPVGTVEVDVPETLPLVCVDAGLVERALANVVENAVRYQPEGRPVRVTAERVDADLVLRVVDQGPGVPDDRKAQIFAAFQQLGDAPRGHGLGLGLAVARGFVEANGGTLEADDTPGGGLTMVLTLPVARGTT